MTGGLPAPNLALIGFMASGKTSVGRALSALTGFPFVDIDARVEADEGMSVAEIFATGGEDRFRRLESEAFRQLCEGVDQIIGCGGGTLLDPANRELLRVRCFSIWLCTSAQEIVRRLEETDAPRRPLVEGKDLPMLVPQLLGDREDLYRSADLTLETDRSSVESIARKICHRLGIETNAAP